MKNPIEVFEYLDKSKDSLEAAVFNSNNFPLVCINRCYYALYYAVTAILLSEDIFVKTHSGAHVKFNELFIKNGILPKSMSITLTEAFAKRQSGDYDIDFEIDSVEIISLINKTQEFIISIDIYLNGLSFDQGSNG